jgi:hypothetical protein
MRQKLFIFLGLFLLVGVLAGLNTASYVQQEEKPDDELNPNRSTYHTGPTGTRAFYDLLVETGRKPARWQEKTSILLTNSKNKPQTFVVVGNVRKEFTDEESEQLLRWVALGGKLVIIDRAPRTDLISTTGNWRVTAVHPPIPTNALGIDPANQQQMTDKTVAGKPLLPTVFTRGVNAVQPSLFASAIKLESFPADKTTRINGIAPKAGQTDEDEYYEEDAPPPPVASSSPSPESRGGKSGTARDTEKSSPNDSPSATPGVVTGEPAAAPSPLQTIETAAAGVWAPVPHVANAEKTLLADFPYGSGQIVFLSDPYIVSNAGIGLVDNAQLAVNIVASRPGTIAFDEYHQGFGTNENQLFKFFSGTPVPAIFAQLALLAGAVLFTQSRRFARPLPAREPNRLSKLEYISAMAALQERTRAYDLAIENIYSEFRRRAAKSFGIDNLLASRGDLAAMIADRTKFDARDIESLMQKCEDIIRGEATNKREVLEITSRLREMEEKLGLKRTRKQAFRK